MAFNTWSLVSRTFTVNDAAGATKGRVMVQGTNAYEVKMPAASNASKIRGIAEFDQTNTNYVTLRRGGSYRGVAASAIAVGDLLNIADTAGRVKTVNEAGGTRTFLVGEALTSAASAGDEVDVDLRLMNVPYVS